MKSCLVTKRARVLDHDTYQGVCLSKLPHRIRRQILLIGSVDSPRTPEKLDVCSRQRYQEEMAVLVLIIEQERYIHIPVT